MLKHVGRYNIEPFFLSGSAGRLFAVCYRPFEMSDNAFVFCPPFAEEMNKSRRMMALAAQRMAAAGTTSLLIDLTGTGDSSGDFCDARWDVWREDIATALDWLMAQRKYDITLCGVRLGAALACEVARSAAPVSNLVFWQPVISGSTFMTQFLRMKIAAQLGAADGGVSTEELRAIGRRGGSVEVAGYDLAPEMIEAIDKLDLREPYMRPSVPIRWLEVVSENRPNIGVLSRKLLSSWRDDGVDVDSETVVGDPFWATAELSLAPALIDKTCRA